MGFFSGVFDSDKLADAINTTKNATKNITGKVAGSFAESAGEMKKFSEETKKMKQPVEGAIMRYGVTYKGGLARYPKQQSGEIGLNIMEECFYLKPTIGTNDWFEEMAIPYAKIKSLEIVERKISNTEWLLSSSDSDMKAMEQKNNIEIEYEDVDGNEQFIRLEMLTGISIYGQAKKCVEFMDVLRQNGILKKFAGNRNAAQNMQGQQMSGVQAGETQAANGDVILEQIEKLAGLKEKGILSEEEYQQKKSELLAKLEKMQSDRKRGSFCNHFGYKNYLFGLHGQTAVRCIWYCKVKYKSQTRD